MNNFDADDDDDDDDDYHDDVSFAMKRGGSWQIWLSLSLSRCQAQSWPELPLQECFGLNTLNEERTKPGMTTARALTSKHTLPVSPLLPATRYSAPLPQGNIRSIKRPAERTLHTPAELSHEIRFSEVLL